MKQGLHKEMEFERDLSPEVVSLMRTGITETQAKETLEILPNVERALEAAEHYFTSFKDDVANYKTYLEGIETAILGSESVRSLYDEEVAEKTSGIALEVLTRTAYRDRPSRARDYWEQETTRQLDR